MTTLTLTQALDLFKDNVSDILDSVSLTLHEDLQAEKESRTILGTSWIANEVRKLRIEYLFGDRIRQVKRIARYKESLTTPPRKGRITDNDIARAKECPITDLYTGKLGKKGGKLWGCCPFHDERTASFVVDTERNRWRCFGSCSTGGDSISFYMKDRGVSFIEAVKALARCA